MDEISDKDEPSEFPAEFETADFGGDDGDDEVMQTPRSKEDEVMGKPGNKEDDAEDDEMDDAEDDEMDDGDGGDKKDTHQHK